MNDMERTRLPDPVLVSSGGPERARQPFSRMEKRGAGRLDDGHGKLSVLAGKPKGMRF